MRTGSRRVVLVTCRSWPELSDSDAALAEALSTRGVEVAARPWNAAPLDDFADADLVVLRSNWDFHHELGAFEAWLGAVEASPARLCNPASLVRAYLDKSWLVEPGVGGARTPATVLVRDVNAIAPVLDWMTSRHLDRAVVKPVWGASGHGVDLVGIDELDAVCRRRLADPSPRPLLVQEFMPQIADGELALVFVAGEYSHALRRQPAAGEFRVNSQYGGTSTLAPDVEAGTIDVGRRVFRALPQPVTYARIDVVGRGDDLTLMEIEVNEPALGLDLAPGAPDRLADGLLALPVG